MIKTASLENSKRLYELAPEWNDCEYHWVKQPNWSDYRCWCATEISEFQTQYFVEDIPAPDLDWLLDKLPKWITAENYYLRIEWPSIGSNDFYAGYMGSEDWYILETAKQWHGIGNGVEFGSNGKYIPICDVLCKLLIKLIEQGIVKVG